MTDPLVDLIERYAPAALPALVVFARRWAFADGGHWADYSGDLARHLRYVAAWEWVLQSEFRGDPAREGVTRNSNFREALAHNCRVKGAAAVAEELRLELAQAMLLAR